MDEWEMQKVPWSTGQEEGSSGHFQCDLQLARTELPFNPGFERKYQLHWLCVFPSWVSVNPPVNFNQFKNRERFKKRLLSPSLWKLTSENPLPKKTIKARRSWHLVFSWRWRGDLQLASQHAPSFKPATAYAASFLAPFRDRWWNWWNGKVGLRAWQRAEH